MAKAADIGSKRLISLAPDAWVQWVTGQSDVLTRDFLASDFQWVSRESDVLLKVFSPNQGEFLILNELQLRYSPAMPRRMRAYAALAEERYKLPVYPVLVNILPAAASVKIENCFESFLLGLQARQDYRVINLWEVDVQIVFEKPLPTLLPFVPLLKGGGEEVTVQRAVQLLRQDAILSELEPLLAFFASFVLNTALVAQILRWDMAVLRESPWYQEILHEGESREGRSLVLRLLTRKLGPIAAEVRSQIESLPLAELENLAEALLEFSSASDLTEWLQSH